MSAPLYNNNQMPANKDITGNKGLWFDRFYDQYDKDTWEVLKPKHTDEHKGNSYWLLEYFHGKKVGNDNQLSSFAAQQKSLTEETLQGSSQIYTANWHFVTGMGNPHPVENGFVWHPTLGVPYLTGAAVKGLIRNYIENNLKDTEENKKQLLLNWFGSTDKDPGADAYESQKGNLIFFDAIPIEAVQLTVDIMTPHMGDWYQKGADKPNQAKTLPADWHDPVPIAFLACNKVSLQFSFGFRQYPENKDKPAEKIAKEDVIEVLNQALEWIGAGAKTAVGYGRFLSEEKIKQRQDEENIRNAHLREGVYLRKNLRNGSFYIEKGRERDIANATTSAQKEIVENDIPDSARQPLNQGKGVKVDALINGKELLKISKIY